MSHEQADKMAVAADSVAARAFNQPILLSALRALYRCQIRLECAQAQPATKARPERTPQTMVACFIKSFGCPSDMRPSAWKHPFT